MSFDSLARIHDGLAWLDAVILACFLGEVYFKIRLHGWHVYTRSNMNKFDFIVTVMSLPSVVLLFHDITYKGVSFFFVFRMVRLGRFCELIWFMPHMGTLLKGIERAFKASVFIFMAFFAFTFFVSLLSCRLFRTVDAAHFGNPIKAFYSIFKIFTVEGWYDVPDAMAQGMGEVSAFFTLLFFGLVVLVGGMFGFSIVNAIFVDEMVRDNHDTTHRKLEAIQKQLDELLAERRNNP